MGRYANHGYEKIYNNEGKIKGINFGYSNTLEHEKGYTGDEIEKKKIDKIHHKLSKGPVVESLFFDSKISNSNEIRLLEGSDGRTILTNELTAAEIEEHIKYDFILHYYEFSTEEIDKMINAISNHPDKENNNYFDVSWNQYSFNIVSTSEESKKDLLELYNSIKEGNVALSDHFPTLFKDKGLSFVLLNKLTKEDIINKYNYDNKHKSKCRRR